MVDINSILIVISFVITFWYIKILRAEIISQKNIISSQSIILKDAKTFLELYDPQKVKDYIAMREETISLNKTKEFNDLISQLDQNRKIMGKEFVAVIELAIHLIASVPYIFTRDTLNKMPDDSLSKKHFISLSELVKEKEELTPGLWQLSIARKIAGARVGYGVGASQDSTKNKLSSAVDNK